MARKHNEWPLPAKSTAHDILRRNGLIPTYPKHLKSFIYPGHYEVRKVSSNGGVRWNAQWLWVSQILGGLHIGLEEVDHQAWDVYFGPILLGSFFEKIGRITDPRGLVMRNPKI